MEFWITWFWGLSTILVLIITFWAILHYTSKHKRDFWGLKMKLSNLNPKESIGKEIDRIYFGNLSSQNKILEEWDKIKSPLMIGYLCDGEIKYRHIIATVLNFIQKKYIEIIETNETNSDNITYTLRKKDLEIFNPKAYENIKELDYNNIFRKKLVEYELSASDVFVVNRIIFNDNNEVNLRNIMEFYDDKNCEGKESKELLAKLIYLEKLINKEFEIYGITDNSGLPKSQYKGKLTNIGIVKRSEWLNYANKIEKETLLKYRDVGGILVWGKYIAYGVSLNVCKIAINDVVDIFMKNN